MAPVLRPIARECAVFVLFAALAVAMTWPLALSMHTGVSDLGDPLLNAWILDWTGKALTHHPAGLFESPMYYPAKLSLAFSENLAGVALLVAPFQLAGMWPVTVYNIAMLLGFALSGYGTYVLARVVTGSTLASIAGGVVFAFVPFKFDHLAHLQIISSGWLPLVLAALLAYWKRPSRTRAALLAIAFVMNGLTNIHYLLFGGFAVAATIVMFAVIEPRRGRAFWLPLLLALGIAGASLLPVLLPYRTVAKFYGMKRGPDEVRFYSGWPSDWLTATQRNVLYGRLGAPEMHRPEQQLWPGLATLVLALAGVIWWRRKPAAPYPVADRNPRALLRTIDVLIVASTVLTYLVTIDERVRWRIGSAELLSLTTVGTPAMLAVLLIVLRFSIRYPAAWWSPAAPSLTGAASRSRLSAEAWAAVLWIVIGVLGALGLHAFFHEFLFHRVEIFRAIRAVGRWVVLAYLGLAVLASMGVVALSSAGGRTRRALTAVICSAVLLFDLHAQIRWEHAPPEYAAVHQWLAKERVAPYVEIPFRGEGIEYRYDLDRTAHHLPSFNGTSGFEPPLHIAMVTAFYEGKYDRMFGLLESNGCRLIILHRHLALSQSIPFREWLAKTTAAGRIAPLRTFDHELGGDFVYAVTRNLPGWRKYREPEVPDGGGQTPSDRFARFLAGEPTFSEAILSYVETPRWGETVAGPLNVAGWALSPFPIRRVTLLLDQGRQRIEIPQVERPDVAAVYPWYYLVKKPGFRITLPERPAGVPELTDVRVEIEDAGGRIRRTPLLPIQWEEAK